MSATSEPGHSRSLVIRLDPVELGHVQVRIERPETGPAHVTLAVERPATLMLLLHDRPQLDRALDAAGIPTEGRTVQFSLASPGGGGSDAPPGRHANPAPAFTRSAAPGGPVHATSTAIRAFTESRIDITA